MQINGSALNTAPLNSLAGAVTPPEPQFGKTDFRWRLLLMIGGVDWSARLTGDVEVDREEGAAGIARFNLALPFGSVEPVSWKGRQVVLTFVFEIDGITYSKRRHTGRIVEPTWDSATRVLSCTSSDQIQQRVEAMGLADIDALTPLANWSEDVFEPVTGRSRWDYAQERISALPGYLDSDVTGVIRYTQWWSAPTPHFIFVAGDVVDGSISVSLADLDSQTNVVEIEAGHRFPRLWQHNFLYSWQHPDTEGLSGENGFCAWSHHVTSELPTWDMVREATESQGLSVLAGVQLNRLPPTGVYCTPPQAWINNSYEERLILGAKWVASLREVQQVTENYKLRVEASQSVDDTGEVISRVSAAVQIENEQADSWESAVFGLEAVGENAPGAINSGGDLADPGTEMTDLRDEARRVAALKCVLSQGYATVVGAHRGTTVAWDVPAAWAVDADLVHTLQLEAQGVLASGKCRQIVDKYSMDSGSALITLSIAVMLGGGAINDALTPPAFDTTAAIPPTGGGDLPTQIGGLSTSPPYDEDLDGFSGNYASSDNDVGQDDYPRRFAVPAMEIPEEIRDEWVVEVAQTYRVAIPNDRLELS